MTGRRILLTTAMLGMMCSAVYAGGGGGEFAGKSAGEWVKILREHKEPKFRRVSLLALETIGPKVTGVTAGLYEALREDPEPEIRREIAILLGRMGPDAKGAPDVLGERLLKDQNELVRQAAATALGGKLAKLADGQVRTLATALKDKHEGTRRAAAETLKAIGEPAAAAVPQLLEVARDPKADRFTRVYALQVISLWGQDDRNTAPALVAILGEKDAPVPVRQAAAEGLGRLGGEDAATVQALGQALDQGPAELRRTAAVSLGQCSTKAGPAWAIIKQTLEDRKGDSGTRYPLIRTAAALARQHTDAIAVLAKLAQDDNAAENRLAAIQELGELGSVADSVTAVLQEIAQSDARATLREAAQAALKKIKGATEK
jgi:HEAT repeat protein